MKGEDDKLFDDFLRKSVGNYQVKPSPAIWKGILQKVPARRIGRIPFSGGNSGLIGFISGGIIISSVVLYNHNSIKHHKDTSLDSAGTLSAQTTNQLYSDSINSKTFVYNNQINQQIEINTLRSESQILDNTVKPSQQTSTPLINTSSAKVNPVTTAFLTKKNHAKTRTDVLQKTQSKTENPTINDDILKTTSTETTPNEPVLAMSGAHSSVLAELNLIKSNKASYYNLSGKINEDITLESDPSRSQPKTLKISKWQGDYAGNNNELSVGIYYHPEWLSNSKNSKYEANRQSAGLSLNWKKRPFILETGLGIMQEKAWQDYDVTYQHLLGTFNNLQYVTFDSVGGIPVPHYHYSIDSIFDPNNQYENHTELATYTYLQLPVYIGFNKSVGRSSFSLKAGGVVSFLLDKAEDKLIIDPDKHRISVSGDHPDRLNTSYQWYLGIGYSYALTDRISFFFEPALRSYINTPYEKKRKQNESPVFVGIRSGITLQFKNPLSK